MTADIVDLRSYRKAKKRAEKEQSAKTNRARHGRGKVERLAEEIDKKRKDADLDGKKLKKESTAVVNFDERDPA